MITREIFKQSFTIRKFEQLLLKLFSEGKLNGTVHTCIGQELTPVVLSKYVNENDTFFSNHRGHGHYIAKTNDMKGLLAEIMGRSRGCSGGYGGSQHLYYPNQFYSNGIQGGMSPVAVGHALAKRKNNEDGISVVFIGDGTLGEGVLYEAMNMAAIYKVPILFVLENNGYAQSTSHKQTFAGNVEQRVNGFGLAYYQASIWDIDKLNKVCVESVSNARNGVPGLLEVYCYRLHAHSKGDDNRDASEIEAYAAKDLLNKYVSMNPSDAEAIGKEIDLTLNSVLNEVEAMPILASNQQTSVADTYTSFTPYFFTTKSIRVNDAINKALDVLLEKNTSLVMIGEDIEYNNKFTPKAYGGAFKVTKDLSVKYPERVFNSPISEAALAGVCIGYSLSGRPAFGEVMFGDFTTLIFDQMLQHASKFCQMFGVGIKLPVIIRTPMGGKRGYGPTHSQSIEKHFLGIPNLFLLAPNYRTNFIKFYSNAVALSKPILLIENKIDYTRYINTPLISTHEYFETTHLFPSIVLRPLKVSSDVTLFVYGGMLADAEEAAKRALIEEEIGVVVICITCLYPLDTIMIIEEVRRTGRVLTVEEGSSFASWGSEILSLISSSGISAKSLKVGNNEIIPSSFLAEKSLLPDSVRILEAIKKIVNG